MQLDVQPEERAQERVDVLRVVAGPSEVRDIVMSTLTHLAAPNQSKHLTAFKNNL